MSEQQNQYNSEEFAQRLHRSLESGRKKKNRHSTTFNLVLIGVGLALVAAMIYILITL